MDKRHQRRDRSRQRIEAAIDRLQQGTATHPRHIGIRVRLTRQAVAREAGVSSATLYRFPLLVQRVTNLLGSTKTQALPPAEQRRRQFLARIEELERQNNALLAENLRLVRELAKRDDKRSRGAVMLSPGRGTGARP